MKKTLLVLSAIATLFAFVSCGGGDAGGDGNSDPKVDPTPVVTVKTVTYSNPYGKVFWDVGDDWAEFTVEFDGVPSKVQFCAEGDITTSANQKWGDMFYSGEITTETKTVVISEALTKMKAANNDSKVTKIALQANNDESATAKIKTVTVKKTDGTTVSIDEPSSLENATLQ